MQNSGTPASWSPARRFGVALILVAVVAAALWYLNGDRGSEIAIPPSDRQMPTSGQVLESDRPDLFEEPGFEKPAEEPEDE